MEQWPSINLKHTSTCFTLAQNLKLSINIFFKTGDLLKEFDLEANVESKMHEIDLSL